MVSDQLLFSDEILPALVFCCEILSALVFFGEIRLLVAIFGDFSIDIEVLTIFLVIMGLCIVCFKLFQIEGECYNMFFCVFCLLVSSKLDLYDPALRGVLEELLIRINKSLGFGGSLVIVLFT